ncbi:hypothetical protein BDA99DRAFT_511581 [Phascolomyces articulosus]|uniref:Uncharacterized protein n=1 Tax=Phascolomyces articulosus TaxID=60185 RepID=A0AAD5K8L4_9FUNG|nr:hypothetical protein BDA99DRAFT_511581 [Phascolomyces articulosus]
MYYLVEKEENVFLLEVCNLYSVCPGSFGCSMGRIMSSPLPGFFLAFISGELFS